MFEKGEFIIYGSNGVCEVQDYMSPAEEEGRIYYVLAPMRSRGSTIFSPVDNQKVLMRKVMTKDEAKEFIAEIPAYDDMEIRESRTQEQQYRQVMQSGSSADSLRLLKALYKRKKKREAAGRRITAVDEKYLSMARDSLVNELSVALEMNVDDVDRILADRMQLEK
ncbi:MAG: CarD family transcriptional regulator [Clostridiales bacterium]|uniref:CarD family transcriptional regulator n=1 Tax=Candidatus Anaerobutyricum stercoripullorum TaxID=2838456 RepID=A0A9D1X3U1_9FIRM|nr:CarD family transcriptional regulator [Clostridiales bacterium]HIX72287.1 CarD family transcriptional regulator [Candidatus Anaerobutyricum stercoripullorum]